MAVIANTAMIPQISADFHLLEVESVEATQGPKFNDPDTLEDRLRVQLRVRTQGESDDSFHVWMSPKLSEQATFGAIVKAILGSTPTEAEFDTDSLIGGRFRSMTSHNDKGWPKLVAGTAAPAKGAVTSKQRELVGAEAPF